jgi:opacity protein-like surface antigen
MKRIFLVSVCLLLLATSASFADSAAGSAFGALATAGTQGMGHGSFGFAVGLADATSFTGSFMYGLSANTDGRIKVGLIDNDGGDTELTIGADFKYQIVTVGGVSKGPFDMAVGGLFEYADYGGVSVVQLGGQYIGSYPVRLESGGTLTPYGRFNIRVEFVDSDLGGSESNLEIGVNGGVYWKVNSSLGLFGEFQIDGNDGIFLGLDLSAL